MKTLGLAALVAAVSFFGCSTDVSDLFSDGGESQGGAGGAPAATTGTGNTAATNGPGPTSTTGGPTTTVAQTTVTNGPTTDTATVTTTVTTGPTVPNVFCNNQECGAGEICCFFLYEKGMDFCSGPGTCPDPDQGWLEIGCNGPDDCPGQQCCGQHNGQNWVDISCNSNCGGLIEMCEPDNPTCTAGQCNQSQVLGNGYGYCGN
jgi:hypothetical protein